MNNTKLKLTAIFLCLSITVKAQLQMDSTYQTDYLKEVFHQAKMEEDSALIGLAAFQLHRNLDWSNHKSAQSLALLTLSVKCFEAVKDSLNYYRARTNLIAYYFDTDSYEEAVRVLLENLDYYRRHDNQLMQVHNSVSIARAYYRLGKMNKAESYYNAAIGLNKVVKDTLINIISWIAKTQIHQEQKHFEKAITSVEEALRLSEITHNFRWITSCHFYLGMNHQFNKDYDKAIGYLTKIEERNRKIAYSDIKKQAYKHLSQCYSEKGNFEKAHQYSIQYAALADSIWKKQRAEELDELTLAFESKEKAAAINILEKENQFVKEANEHKNIILYGLSFVLLILSILFWLLIRSYRDKIKKDKIITSQVKAISQQKIHNLENDIQLTAVKSMLDGQEKERSRIALDLHDSLGGLLSTIKLKLKQDVAIDSIEMSLLLDHAADEVRSIAKNLQPSALQQLGLIPAINDLINSKNKLGQAATISFQYYNVTKDLQIPIALQLYRIIQESLNNAIKHAHASEILIQINGEEKGLALIIEDNGKGFDTSQITSGQGLKNLQKRTTFLQAELNIDSSTAGTTVNLFLPIELMPK